MATITDEEYKSKEEFDFNGCRIDRLILNDLADGEYLISEDPYYFQGENGVMAGIDDRFTYFQIIDEKGEVTQEIRIRWNTECAESESFTEAKTDNNLIDEAADQANCSYRPYLIALLTLVFITVWIRKGKTNG